MKVLLIKKECTFLTAVHFIYYFLIIFLDFDILNFFLFFLEKRNSGDPCVFCKETSVSAFIFNLTLLSCNTKWLALYQADLTQDSVEVVPVSDWYVDECVTIM